MGERTGDVIIRNRILGNVGRVHGILPFSDEKSCISFTYEFHLKTELFFLEKVLK